MKNFQTTIHYITYLIETQSQSAPATCQPNIKQNIYCQNKSTLQARMNINESHKLCNNRKPPDSPGPRQQTWRDLRWTNLKTRFAKHKTSFNNPSKRMSTELNKYVWSLKDSNINFRITWKILKQAITYNPSSKHCNLCHVGIYFIIFKPHLATLNSVDTLANLCWKISSPLLLHNGTHGNSVVSTVNAV